MGRSDCNKADDDNYNGTSKLKYEVVYIQTNQWIIIWPFRNTFWFRYCIEIS